MIAISEFHSNLQTLNKIKILLLTAPIVIGSGICLYYYYRNSSKNDKNSKCLDKSKNKVQNLLKEKLKQALDFKNQGNDRFKEKKYEEAQKLYSDAIQICPSEQRIELSTFYQNRSACFEHLKSYEQVIDDSSKAIEYNKKYIKAYLRRGKAYEILNKFEEAAFDYYAASCATQFQNSDYMKLLYEALDKYCLNTAQQILNNRQSHTFQKYLLKHLFNKLSRDPLKKKANEILNNYDEKIQNLLSGDVENLDLDDLLLKGTIEYYIGKHEDGIEKLKKVLNSPEATADYKVNALLKLTEYNFQNNKLEEAESLLKQASEIDSNHPDIYYVQSQLQMMNKNTEESLESLKKSIEIDPNFVVAIGTKLTIEYQQAIMLNDFIGKNRIMKEFERNIKQFPESNELLVNYFQILLSSNESQKAEQYILQCLSNDSDDPTLYVYRALMYLENGDMEKTKDFLDQALKIDSKCSFAYEILSDLCAKIEKFDDSVHYLEKAALCSTTFEDIKNFILKKKMIEFQLKGQAL